MSYEPGSTADLRRRWKHVLTALQDAGTEFKGTDSLLAILDADADDYRLQAAIQAAGLIDLATQLAAAESRTVEGDGAHV